LRPNAVVQSGKGHVCSEAGLGNKLDGLAVSHVEDGKNHGEKTENNDKNKTAGTVYEEKKKEKDIQAREEDAQQMIKAIIEKVRK
jgi:hypothetical protein